MENNHLNNPNFLHKRQGKDNKRYRIQEQIFYEYLLTHTVTCTMAFEQTGIPQKNLCRIKRELEKNGMLWVAFIGRCKSTGRNNVQYLTTNPANVSRRKQLKIF